MKKNKYIQFDVIYNNGDIKSYYPFVYRQLFGEFMKGNIYKILGVDRNMEYHTIFCK